MNAVIMHKEHYNSFATENVIVGMGNYIFTKDYHKSTRDIAVAGICNAINIPSTSRWNFHGDSPYTRTPKHCFQP